MMILRLRSTLPLLTNLQDISVIFSMAKRNSNVSEILVVLSSESIRNHLLSRRTQTSDPIPHRQLLTRQHGRLETAGGRDRDVKVV